MSWTLKTRGDSTAPIVAEFECPVHGRFEATVPRGTEEAKCMAWLPPTNQPYPTMYCGEWSPWVISAPAGHVKAGEVIRGKSDPHPPDRYVMDTRPLAEGMPLHEFKAKRAELHREISLKRAKKAAS